MNQIFRQTRPQPARPLEILRATQYKIAAFSGATALGISFPAVSRTHLSMISVAAIRMQQFGVQFYQASLTASDIDKLVRFEVLSYGEQAQPVRGRKKVPAPT